MTTLFLQACFKWGLSLLLCEPLEKDASDQIDVEGLSALRLLGTLSRAARLALSRARQLTVAKAPTKQLDARGKTRGITGVDLDLVKLPNYILLIRSINVN